MQLPWGMMPGSLGRGAGGRARRKTKKGHINGHHSLGQLQLSPSEDPLGDHVGPTARKEEAAAHPQQPTRPPRAGPVCPDPDSHVDEQQASRTGAQGVL